MRQVDASLLTWKSRHLIFELAKRDFCGKYRGSYGGVLWSLLQPLFLLTIYTIAFGVILKARWGYAGGTENYALMLFSGLLILNVFTECLTQAPKLIANNPNFVKKVVFPLEVLPIAMVLVALVHLLLGISCWLLGYIIFVGVPKWTVIYLPVILLSFMPVLLGFGWLFSAIGVFVKDLHQLTAMVSHVLLFLTPIFYSIEAAPPKLQFFLALNPLTFIIDQVRLVLIFGEKPGMRGLALYLLLSVCFAWASLKIFKRLQPTFSDVV